MTPLFHRLPIGKFLIPQILGILSSLFISIPDSVFWIFFLITLGALFSIKYQLAIPVILFLILLYRTDEILKWEPPTFESESHQSITAVVDKITKTAKRMKYEITLQSPFYGHKAIYRWDDSLLVYPGDTLIISGKLHQPTPPRNPGAFNYQKYLKTNRISFLFSRESIIESIQSGEWSMNHWFYSLRLKINNIIHHSIESPFSGVMLGLVLGEKGEIDPDIISNYQQLGVVHILAVSGLHVGYMLLILLQIGKLLRMNDSFRFILICAGLIFYMGLTGYRPSVVRAGIMAILYAYGKYREKSVNSWNILGFTAFLLLLINPTQLFSAGFQLSFGAVTGILFTISRLPILEEKFERFKKIRRIKWFRYLSDGFTGSFGAQLGTFLPLALVFKSIPVWGIIVNLIIIPIAGIVVVAGFVTVIVGFVSTSLSSIFGTAGWGIIWLMNKISLFFDFLPNQTFYTGSFTVFELILVFLLVFTIWNFQMRSYPIRITITALVIGIIFVFKTIFIPDPLRVTFLDVGQGDSTVLEYQDKVVLIDAGFSGFGRDYGKWVLNPYFKYRGITEIDLVIMTHPHADHIGGLPSVFENVKAKEIWDTWNSYDSNIYSAILLYAQKHDIPFTKPEPGDMVQFGDVTLTVLYPDSNQSMSARNINNASIVVRVDHGENSFLLLGDAEVRAERIISGLGKLLDVDVVKLGHHGSKTSSIQSMVDLTTADIGIVSLGERNKYGHPSMKILNRWEESGTNLYRTDQSGAVTIYSDGKQLRVKSYLDEN